jgi:hypothetical protein
MFKVIGKRSQVAPVRTGGEKGEIENDNRLID